MGRCERIHRNLGGQIDESLKRHRYEDKQEEKNAKHSLKDCRLPDIFQTVVFFGINVIMHYHLICIGIHPANLVGTF